MAAGEQGDQRPLEHALLADDDVLRFEQRRFELSASVLWFGEAVLVGDEGFPRWRAPWGVGCVCLLKL
jgi:hypothetical protein